VSLRGEPPCLDCVSEDHGRAVGDGVGPPKSIKEVDEVGAPEIADRFDDRSVVQVLEHPRHVTMSVPLTGKPLA
jgi:hypothetical protein